MGRRSSCLGDEECPEVDDNRGKHPNVVNFDVKLDGYRSCQRLAGHLGGEPLRAEHGAPIRLVSSAQYAYKSVKHVIAIEYRRDYDPGPARWAAHPRGRVEHEERSRFLPGPLWRPIWRAVLPGVRRRFGC
ncbi:hypothetical protein D5S17_04370 [Pseudonocardiaceae bacterium YIM PH 21723]|nr:hypothetical protein D5S17_04370 [Pseudonocardiaceae bacterium YIM PH 21723]